MREADGATKDVSSWRPLSAMPRRSDDVRCLGQTGSGRPTVKPTLLTHNRHRTRSRIWYRLWCAVLTGKGDQRLASSLKISRAKQAGVPIRLRNPRGTNHAQVIFKPVT